LELISLQNRTNGDQLEERGWFQNRLSSRKLGQGLMFLYCRWIKINR
jgi:hypothetical protein